MGLRKTAEVTFLQCAFLVKIYINPVFSCQFCDNSTR